jgi:hypothetical protein
MGLLSFQTVVKIFQIGLKAHPGFKRIPFYDFKFVNFL